VASKPITAQRPAISLQAGGKLLLMVAAALLIVTVVGCMVGPDYRPPAMTLPAHWNGNDQQEKQAENQEDKTDLSTWCVKAGRKVHQWPQ